MNLIQALESVQDGKVAITRPHLLAERSVYMTYEGPGRPLKQRWIGRPGLTLDWSPSASDLLADDWIAAPGGWVVVRAS